MRRAFDAGVRHFGFQFLGSYEGPRLFQALPFEENGEVVDVFSAAENTATALAVLAPPVEGGIKCCFPGRIVGDLVMDDKINHDGGRSSLLPKNLLQTREK